MLAGLGWAGTDCCGGDEAEGAASALERLPTGFPPPSPLPFAPPPPALLAAPLASGPAAAALGLAAGLPESGRGGALAALAAAARSLASHEYFSLALSARSTSDAWFL